MTLLSIEDLDVFYGKAQALHGVTLDVDAGKIVAIIGPNGAGKSTLLDSIVGLTKRQGKITFDGRDVTRKAPAKIVRHETVRRIINILATDVQQASSERIADTAPGSVDDVRQQAEMLIVFSASAAKLLQEARGFLRDKLYRHHYVVQSNERAKRTIEALYASFANNPEQLPPKFQELSGRDGVERAVVDYLSGMTDNFALATYRRLFLGET